MRRILLSALCLAALWGVASAQVLPISNNRNPRPRIFEPGFRAEKISECGSLGLHDVRRYPNDLSTYLQVRDIECSPGDAWGPYVYLALDGLNPSQVHIERISFQGEAESFVFAGHDRSTDKLSFSPPGWREGDRALLSIFPEPFDPDLTTHLVAAYDPNGQPAGGGLARTGRPLIGTVGVDPTGYFDYDLFWMQGRDLYRRDAGGNVTLFVRNLNPYPDIRWGPGGGWGTDLYVGSQAVSPDGSVRTVRGVNFGEFDWPEGEAFGGDMFLLRFTEPPPLWPPNTPFYHPVYRVQPDGTRTLFARVTSIHMAACDGALWFAGRGCWVIRPAGRPTTTAPVRRMDLRESR